MNINLRQYQKDTCHNIINKLNNYDLVLSTAAMGAGKSIIITYLTYLFLNENKNIIILINIDRLYLQLKKLLNENNIQFNTIKSNDTFIEEKNKITLIMEQSFKEKHYSLFNKKQQNF